MFNDNTKVMVVSPHMDDEVLGCGGILAQLSARLNNQDKVLIWYGNDVHPNVPYEQYMKENENVITWLNAKKILSPWRDTNNLPSINISMFISEFEKHINEFRPDVVLLPFPSYNQDHRHLFEAMITASRVHDKNWFVRNILVYEQPETVQTNRIEPRFNPTYYVPININDKLNVYGLYESQVRNHRSKNKLMHLAGYRGMQCNADYAEAFMVIRMTE